jgi:hypothetical protein
MSLRDLRLSLSLMLLMLVVRLSSLRSSSTNTAESIGAIKSSLGVWLLQAAASLRTLPDASADVFHSAGVRLVRRLGRSAAPANSLLRATARRGGASGGLIESSHEALHPLRSVATVKLLPVLACRRQVPHDANTLVLPVLWVVLIPEIIVGSRGVLLCIQTLSVRV